MFFFLIYCFSFILLSKPLFKSLPVWKHRMKMLSIHFFLGELSKIFFSWSGKRRTALSFLEVSIFKPSMNRAIPSRLENVFDEKDISLLDLPDLALESILERLSPEGLCNMAEVCSSLRKECRSDHLWDRHMKQKWGKLIGSAAYREWQWHIALAKRQSLFHCRRKQNGLFGYLPNLWKRTKIYCDGGQRNSIPNDSIMNWYLTLESGKFCFPAQVYNRGVQNGQVGFMLSCYDAEVSYDFQTNTFSVRYSGIGRRTTEENVEWNRLRAPAVDTPAYVLHVSDCLGELKPGDHVEIQWRRNAEFPYGWWYGVVGHLESCCGNESVCRCLISDTVKLEFKQYRPGSRWREIAINRKDHREVGTEADGFYGGIIKLYSDKEISMWKSLWPTRILD